MTSYFSFATHTDAVLFLSFIILIIFGVKIALNAFIQNVDFIGSFRHDPQVSLRKRLARAYIRAPYLFHTTKRPERNLINIMQGHVNLLSAKGSSVHFYGCVERLATISSDRYISPHLVSDTLLNRHISNFIIYNHLFTDTPKTTTPI